MIRGLLGRMRTEAHPVTAPPVVAVSGMGGIGKTALVTHCAHLVRAYYPDGQLFLSLKGTERTPEAPTALLARILRALQGPTAGMPADLDEQAALFRSLVADRALLIVLDDARDTPQIRPLLPAGSSCAVLVTSRQFLGGIEGARHLVLSPLPAAEGRELLGGVRGRTAAEAVRPAAETVSAILDHCGGLPLAIRIMAARLAAPGSDPLSITRGLADAARRLDGLVTEDLSVRVTLDTSLDLLRADPLALRTFLLLGGWPGSDIVAPAAASALGVSDTAAQDALSRLADRNLLLVRTGPRYHLHDLVRLYAAEHAAASPPEPQQLRGAMAWYLRALDAAIALVAPYLPRPQPTALPTALPEPTALPAVFEDRADALAWCTREHPNLLALIHRAAQLEDEQDDRFVWQATVLLMPFFEQGMYWSESITAHLTALDSARRSLGPECVGRVLVGLAAVHLHTARYDDTHRYCDEALQIFEDLDDQRRIGTMLDLKARALEQQGRLLEAVATHEQALTAREKSSNPFGIASTLNHLAGVLHQLGSHAEAVTRNQESLAVAREHGMSYALPPVLQGLGRAQLGLGEHEQALAAFTEAVSAAQSIGDRIHEAESLRYLGDTLLATGRTAQGLAHLRSALALMEALGHRDEPELRHRLD